MRKLSLSLTSTVIPIFIVLLVLTFAGCKKSEEDTTPKEATPAKEGAEAEKKVEAPEEKTKKEIADTVYKNGKIYTVNEKQPWVEAVAIKDGKFIKVGSNNDVTSMIGDDTKIVDLGGKFAMPGIVDSHNHPYSTPIYRDMNLSFSDPTNPDLMMEELKAYAEANPDKDVIRGSKWGLGVYPGNNPSKTMLDAIVPDRPVALLDATGHALWLNSKGLEAAGITADTPSIPSAVVEKDPETGEPTGVVREGTIRKVEQAFPQPPLQEYSKAIQNVFSRFNSLGVTSMQTAEGHELALNATQILERADDLTMRLFVSWDWHLANVTPYTNEEMDAQIAGRAKYASDLISPNFVKIFTDGTPDGYAVPFIEPYGDGSGKYGTGVISPEDLKAAVIKFDADGLGVLMHAIGDASVRAALDAVEAARAINGNTGVRHKISHANWVHPDDYPRFGTIPGLSVDISPAVTYPSPSLEGYVPLLGEDRLHAMWQSRTFLESGANLAYGSDWLTLIPPSPWMPMQGFVTRVNPEAPEKGVLGKNQNLTIEEAIQVFTLNGAYAVSADDRIGSIEEGKLADFIVLDRNILDIPIETLKDTQVDLTIVGGKEVYKK